MAYTKRTWLGRQGTGLNKFSIGGASPVTIVNQPDSVTQVGDALSAGNLNDLEDRIEDAFDDVDTALDAKADEQDVTNLNNAITAIDHRLDNLEQAKGDYVVQNYKDGAITPSGKGAWSIVEGVRGVSRVENSLITEATKTGSAEGLSYSRVNNHVTVTGTYQSGGDANAYIFSYDVMPETNGHNYLVFVTNPKFSLYIYGATTVGVQNAIVFPATASGQMQLTARTTGFSNGATVNESFDVIVCDLSVYFGTTDLSFLGATNAEKLATIQTNYPHLLTPSDYGVRIVDSSYSGVRAVGKNLVSGYVAEEGFWNTDGWQATSGIKSSVKIPVRAGATYIGSFYDKQGNRINNLVFTPFVNEDDAKPTRLVTTSTITLTGNEKYLAVRNYSPQSSYITGNNYQYQLEEGSSATAYSPYMTDTLSLTFQGKSAGSVYDQLETNAEIVQEIDGQKVTIYKKRTTQRIVSTALDNKTWIRRNDGLFYTSTPVFSDAKDSSSNVLCDKFLPCPSGQTGTSTPEGCISVGSGGYIYAMKAGIADTTAFLAYVADSVLYSEAKTESVTLSDPLIDNTLLTESGGRMATVQTGTVVDGSFDMGFITL